MFAKRYTLTNGSAVPEVGTKITTLVADVSNAGNVIVLDKATGNVVSQLSSGDQATDYAHGDLSDLYTFTITGTDKLHISVFFV
jgi:hypothetical protein